MFLGNVFCWFYYITSAYTMLQRGLSAGVTAAANVSRVIGLHLWKKEKEPNAQIILSLYRVSFGNEIRTSNTKL